MRPTRRWIEAARWALFATLLFAGCASPIVGAECREGFLRCDGVCVDPSSDPANCGACDVECPDWAMCSAGACVGRADGGFDGAVPDGALPDGALPDGAVLDGEILDAPDPDATQTIPDGSIVDGEVIDGALPDGSLPDGALPDGALPDGALPDGSTDPCASCTDTELCCASACVDPLTSDAHCGGCGIACDTIEECVAGVCEPICAPPTSYCDGLCVLLDVDPDNCGVCGRRCPTGLCSGGLCIDASPGHVVLIGHSYDVSRTVIRRVVGNAVWLANAAEIDVGVYEGDARSAARSAVTRAIDETASGRIWNRMPLADLDALTDALPMLEVVVVHAQRDASDAELAALGAGAGPFLRPFVAGGGVVVVLDGGGMHAGTWQVLAAAGLLDAAGRTALGNVTLDVVSPADAVATGLPFRYRAENESVSFTADDGAEVVVSAGASPVVLHRVVSP